MYVAILSRLNVVIPDGFPHGSNLVVWYNDFLNFSQKEWIPVRNGNANKSWRIETRFSLNQILHSFPASNFFHLPNDRMVIFKSVWIVCMYLIWRYWDTCRDEQACKSYREIIWDYHMGIIAYTYTWLLTQTVIILVWISWSNNLKDTYTKKK